MIFKVGDRIELVVKSDPYKGEYASQILNLDQERLLIALPISQGHFVPVRPGSDILVRVLKKDAAYEFEATVLERVDEDSVNKGLLLPMPEKMFRAQRRGDVRVEVTVPIEILIYDQPTADQWRTIPGRTIDLSAGGARIETEEEFNGTFRFEIIIKLPGHEPMRLPCRYIRGGRVLGLSRYWTAVRFEPIKERDQRQILKFVFRKQQDLRAKGLI